MIVLTENETESSVTVDLFPMLAEKSSLTQLSHTFFRSPQTTCANRESSSMMRNIQKTEMKFAEKGID
jgi:hypothetical protein